MSRPDQSINLVHHSFEAPDETPVLRLEENLTAGFGKADILGASAEEAMPAATAAIRTKTPQRVALCVGVDTYPAPNALHGCVNDSKEWETLFRSLDYSVTALRNEAATRAAITDALARHVSGLKAGDVFLFQYAGHGTQFDDESGDEPDGKDEALCPVDMMAAGFIRDDEIRDVLNRVPAGALVVSFIDCCHSGSIVRMIRAIGKGNDGADRAKLARAIVATEEMIDVHRRTRTRGRVTASGLRRDVAFTACRDDQVAFETSGHGDFTSIVVPILKQGVGGLTNLVLQKRIRDAFGAEARQNPMLDCDPAAEGRTFLQP